MIPDKYENDFYSSKRGEIVKFSINDSAEITSGPFKGVGCAVISIEQIEPEVIFLVERGDNGAFFKVKQTELQMLALYDFKRKTWEDISK